MVDRALRFGQDIMYAVVFKDCIADANTARPYADFQDALDEYNELREIYSVELPELLNQLCVVKIYENTAKEVIFR